MTAAEDPFEGINLNEATYEPIDEPIPQRTRKPRSDKGQPRGTRSGRTSNKQLAEELLLPWALMAQGIAMTAPTASAVMLKRGEDVTNALVSIAGQHPKMLAALKKASKIGPGVTLARTGVEIITAVALDFGRIPPEHPLAMATHVSDLYIELHPQNDNIYPMNPGTGFSPQGFTPFATPVPGA